MEFTTVGNDLFVNYSLTRENEINQSSQHCLGRENVNEHSPAYSVPAKVILSILATVFCLIAFFGNLTVITAIVKDREISKHKQNRYLLSLAVADALVVVFVVPFSLTNELLGSWPFGEVYCRIYLSVDILLCTASICNICCIGVDRLVSVKFPATYRRYRTTKKIRFAIGFIWVYAAAVSLLPFFGETKLLQERLNECFVNDSSWFIILSSSLSFFLPAFIIGPVYINIFLIGKRLEQSKRARYATSHQDPGEARPSEISFRVRCGSRSPSLWRRDVNAQPALSPAKEKVQSSIKFNPTHFRQTEDRLVRSSSLGTGQAKTTDQTNSEKPERPSVKLLENQDNRTFGQFLAPPLSAHSPSLTPTHQPNNKKERPDVSLIEERQSNSIHSDEVFLVTHSASTDKFLRNESGQEDAVSFPVYTRGNSSSYNYSQQEENEKLLNIISGLLRACCAKLKCRKDDGHPQVHIIKQTEGNYLKTKRPNERLFSSSSVLSNVQRNSALARRASAMSTQSNALSNSRRERRFIFIISVVTGCFLLCWSPFFMTYFVYAVCRKTCCINPTMFKAFFWVGYLNSAVNPVLYTIFNKDFRLAFKRLFQCSKRDSW